MNNCAHALRVDGRWIVPLAGGMWGVRRVSNGSLQVVWTCDHCGNRSTPIPHHEAQARGVDIPRLPLVEDYAGVYGRCIVRGCESGDVEWNHFGPRAIFQDEADDWPAGYLCVKHHREWGERVTPQLNPPGRPR